MPSWFNKGLIETNSVKYLARVSRHWLNIVLESGLVSSKFRKPFSGVMIDSK